MDLAQQVAERRPAYLSELAQGTDRFHEPRRADCPWCGSRRLRTRLRTTDLLQHKPGRFVVDECRDCAHSFQNPRLNPEGLDFYYRDFYDGIGAKNAERTFANGGSRKRYLASARALRVHDEPESWLDVGTGHGHFPATAKEVHPYTAFDGLDLSDGVENAKRDGRIEEAHRGLLPELAASLAGRYDAMSMFHYLEHSTDPRAELVAARTVLRPGGHLMIEVPDPDCGFAKLLGKWWVAYLQPQHLHLMPLKNLRRELESLGFTVVATDRREAHVPADLTAALLLVLNHVLPHGDDPWRPRRPSKLHLRARAALFWCAVPALLATQVVDRLLAPLLSRHGFANAYRVIARRGADT
ncbi:class I SAM-dependent methyltransferase [Actinomycetota bacterium Odt1-20B]